MLQRTLPVLQTTPAAAHFNLTALQTAPAAKQLRPAAAQHLWHNYRLI
jgi:hypothetical protein